MESKRLCVVTPQRNLVFSGPAEQLSTELSIENVTAGVLLFKIKTTHSDKYRVKPHLGHIAAGSTVTVHISRRHPTTAEFRDKFQIITAPHEGSQPLESLDIAAWCAAPRAAQHRPAA